MCIMDLGCVSAMIQVLCIDYSFFFLHVFLPCLRKDLSHLNSQNMNNKMLAIMNKKQESETRRK